MANLSGKAWYSANQAKYPNSEKVGDLDGGFQGKVKEFIEALKDAGAKVKVSSTLRDASRAYVMHYSWKLAKGSVKPKDVPKRTGVDIEWDHGDDEKSKAAAQEMVSAFGIVYEPSLTSRHIEGKAIDMDITWGNVLKIKNKKGEDCEIKSTPKSGQNKELWAVGKTYGVIKKADDPPHWSTDGK